MMEGGNYFLRIIAIHWRLCLRHSLWRMLYFLMQENGADLLCSISV